MLTGIVDPTEPPTYAEKIDASSQRIPGQRLQGIFSRENSQFAIIDNQIVEQNGSLADGSKVILIANETAKIMKSDGQSEILALPGSVRRDGN